MDEAFETIKVYMQRQSDANRPRGRCLPNPPAMIEAAATWTTAGHSLKRISPIQSAMADKGGDEREKDEIVICSIHWGPNWASLDEYSSDGRKYRRTLAHRYALVR